MLKLTSRKTLALNNVLHVPNIRTNLVSVALLGNVGVKLSFESDKIVMTKNWEKGFVIRDSLYSISLKL